MEFLKRYRLTEFTDEFELELRDPQQKADIVANTFMLVLAQKIGTQNLGGKERDLKTVTSFTYHLN